MLNFDSGKASDIAWLADQACTLRQVGETMKVLVNGIEIDTWIASGSDKTLVFLHGNSACKEVFHEQFCHFHGLGYTVVALDLPGHGHSANSTNPEEDYTGTAYARLIIQLLDDLRINKPVIAGWSLGGHIGIEMLGQGYDIGGLCLFGTPPVGPGPEFFDQAFLNTEFAHVTGTADVSLNEMTGYTKALYGSLSPTPAFLLAIAIRTVGLARSTMLEHWLSNVEGYNQRHLVKHTDVPTLVIQGLDDQFCSPEYLRSLEWGNLWSEKIFEFDGIGHAPFLEMPDPFNTLLEQFMADILHHD